MYGFAFLNLYIDCFISPTIYTLLFEIREINSSWTLLVSWYSSIIISFKLFFISSLTNGNSFNILIERAATSLNSYILFSSLYFVILSFKSVNISIMHSTYFLVDKILLYISSVDSYIHIFLSSFIPSFISSFSSFSSSDNFCILGILTDKFILTSL